MGNNSTQEDRDETVSELEGRTRQDAVYTISIAAEIVSAGVQTLRMYETRGLVRPARTPGGTRRYSSGDIERLHRIIALLDAGLNLAGVAMVLELQDENARLRAR